MTSVKDWIELLKLPPSILASISLFSGLILFIPEHILKKLYMVEFRDKYGFVIGIIFLIAISLLLVILIIKIFKIIKKRIEESRLEKNRIKYLENSDKTKVKLIKVFLKEETHTLQLPVNDGLTSELSYFCLISLAGGTQAVDFDFDNMMYARYFLQPWVINIINKNENLRKKFLSK